VAADYAQHLLVPALLGLGMVAEEERGALQDLVAAVLRRGAGAAPEGGGGAEEQGRDEQSLHVLGVQRRGRPRVGRIIAMRLRRPANFPLDAPRGRPYSP